MAVASGTGGIDAQLATYFADFADRMPELRKQFAEDGYIEIPDFAPAEVKERLLVEVDEMLEKHSRRRHLEVKSTGNSPRYYEAVGRNTIVENAEVIPYVYQSPLLKDFLAQLTGETEIVPVPWEPEEIVITRMTQAGDSHGWHWDDYSYSLIWIIEAPTPEDGGSLEYVRDTSWDKENPRIAEYLERGPIERRHPATGSVYLLKADTAMHRVAPLTGADAKRVILCYSYATLADLEREVTHETMEELYPEDHATSSMPG